MLVLPLLVKRNLLISCIVMASALLHGLIIFYVNDEVESQSSIGDQFTLLLEVDKPIDVSSTAVLRQDKKPVIVKKQIQPAIKKTVKENTKKSKKIEQALKEIKKDATKQERKINHRTGNDLDLSGKELSAQAYYRQRALRHLLKNMSSAPALGSAEVKLTLMSAGIAIKIDIELLSGPERYKQWLQRRILSANPFPPFPREFEESSLVLSFPISHHD